MKRLILFALLVAPVLAFGQTYSIDWSKISGGGGTSSGGSFSLSGTIGQADAGSMSGGNFSLQGGFWSIASVVQTINSPLLNVVASGGNYVLSWPSTSTGFRLQVNNNLSNSNGWSVVGQGQVTNGATISVTVPATTGNNFYRLLNP